MTVPLEIGKRMWNYLIQSHDPGLRPARYIDLPADGPVRASIAFMPDPHKDEVTRHIENLKRALADQIEVEITTEDIDLLGLVAHVRAVNGSHNRKWFAEIIRHAVPHAFTGIAEARVDTIRHGQLVVSQAATITVTEGAISPQAGLITPGGRIDQRFFAHRTTQCIGPGVVVRAHINKDHTQISLAFNNSLDLWLGPINMAVWAVCDLFGLDCRMPVKAY